MHGGRGGMWSEVAADALQLRSLLSNFRGTMRAKIFISTLALLVGLGAAAPAVAVEKSALQQLQQKVLRDYEKEREREKVIFGGKTEAEYFARIPAGSFRMGDISGGGQSDEKPVHRVSVKAFLLGKTEVTVGQFRAFINDSGYKTEAEQSRGCRTYEKGSWDWRLGKNWRNPGFRQSAEEPVVCVSWNDAQRYIEWLSKKTGAQYRLPSEAEWEHAARAGSDTKYSWGNSIGRNKANCDGCGSRWDDSKTAPVASFATNGFGLYDMHGNVWEWTQDCWNGSYRGAPSDGSAWLKGDCEKRVLRGGSWYSNLYYLRSASRGWSTSVSRYSNDGFRLARTLD